MTARRTDEAWRQVDEGWGRQAAVFASLGEPSTCREYVSLHHHLGVGTGDRLLEIPFAWEFPDPAGYARALAASGPAHEAIQAVGEEAFLQHATGVAEERVRDGLPLRAELEVVGHLGRRPARSRLPRPPADPSRAGFVAEPDPTPEVERLYAEDVEDNGFVMNGTRMWAHQPALHDGLFDLQTAAREQTSLTTRERGVLIAAMAATLGAS